MTQMASDVVLAWLAAVNATDVDAALVHTAPDVAIIGPRGTSRGREVLRAWVGHAGATFATRAIYARGDTVVVAQHGTWRDPVTGAVQGEAEVATRFLVVDGQVTELQRYDDLTTALAEAQLTPADEVPPSSGVQA